MRPEDGARCVDFASALYLGMRHARARGALTLGKPAALEEPPGAAELARELAALQGCEAATLLPSTLHLYLDLFEMLARGRTALLVDGAAYPIARLCAACAFKAGPAPRVFRHGDSAGLARLAGECRERDLSPVVLADGYSPGDRRPPPLADYAGIARGAGGLLVLDDTQALGVLGERGGGSVRLHGLAGAPVAVGASLAKGFGAPLAVLGGGVELVARFERQSASRAHASPPSAAVIAAARQALRENQERGEHLRGMLLARVRQFRGGLAEAGVACLGGDFPVQVVPLPARGLDEGHAAAMAAALNAVPLRSGAGPALAFLLRADHAPYDVAHVVALLIHHLREAS
ncbi:aminotransferase class I/II-fold pyridoxal phosphate-dependent enzyme [Pseudoduganella namucuonensis]|uniref:8-amino-7-oxononanoate synthase n=1 Tax=Pseudoduganella namucuonensis TaxID=1035707 RepID=A0A1I7HNW2_9BURK|nr:aminotransferase class I/II-fold pyridoxal phosphate-dependent enzyme [Pseudoduganella namucuonensis]SFU62353.1 8-amino-7-oxononanoate synthase [Pseudoduganella namucuonensis]